MNANSHLAQYTEAKYSFPTPIQDAIKICRGELCAANYAVVQIGHSKLIGCKPGHVEQFVEVTLKQSANADTQVVFHCTRAPLETITVPGAQTTHQYA
jgi:hypothetical protein